MATNVFLVFFYGYGVPAVPVLAYFILDRTGHQVIGSATLWCWVASDVEWMRIAFFYAPAWVVITVTISIYIVTGYRIWRKRVELRSVSRGSKQFLRRDSLTAPIHDAARGSLLGMNNIMVTTQIKCDVQTNDTISRAVSPELDQNFISSFASIRLLSKPSRMDDLATESSSAPIPIYTPSFQIEDIEAQRILHQGTAGRNGYRATVVAASPTAGTATASTTLCKSRPATKRTAEGHAAAMAYFQVAFLMFLALFVVWLPSSINRMYQFTKNRPSFALNVTSAIVLPLQGAWNATIYIFTTRRECKQAWSTVMSKLSGKPRPNRTSRGTYRKGAMTSSQDTRESAIDVALDDVTKHNVDVRHSEVSNHDAMEPEAQPDREFRCAVNSSLPRDTTVALQ
ncbi:unnamed protein product [Alternaria alternata]